MAIESKTSLLEFMESERLAASKANEATDESQAVDAVADQSDAVGSQVDADSSVAEETDGEPVEAAEKSPAEIAYLRAFLAKANLDSTGIEDDELEEMVLRELRAEPSVSKKQETVKDDLAPPLPRKDIAEPKVGEPVEPANKTESERSVERLEYDARLAAMVTFDDSQRAVPKDDSEESRDAAKKINAYSAARRERVEKLVDDPIGFLMQDLRREMKTVVSEEINGFKAEQQSTQKRAAQERLEREESERVASILQEGKARFYELGTDGQPRKLMKTGEPVMTEFGRAVDAEFTDLKLLSPNAPDSILLEKAIKIAERYAAPKPKEEVVAEVVDKKKKFIESDRKSGQPGEREVQPATLDERIELKSKMTLYEAILNDPDNIDNPVVARLRQNK